MQAWMGERVRLRAMEPSDVDEFVAQALAHPEDEREEGEGYLDFPSAEASLRQIYARSVDAPNGPSRGWSIETLADGKLVGGMATPRADPRVGTFLYGVSIFTSHRRRGYASDAIRTLVGHYFAEHRYQKVNVCIHEFNAASIALHEKLGFVLEGRIRRAVFTRGQHFDQLWYGMTDDEFWARHPQT